MPLWLHIGSPKTGSSALQIFLQKNQSILGENGFQYVTPRKNMASSNQLAAAIRGRRGLNPSDVAKKIFRRFEQNSQSDFILSSEELFLSPAKSLRNVLAPHIDRGVLEINIVLYLRRQDLFMESFFSQRRKTGLFSGDISEFVERFRTRELDYEALLEEWQVAFPEAVIHLRRFERERLKNGDIIDDFLDVIGMKNKLGDLERQKDVNIHPTRDIIDLMDMIANTKVFNPAFVYRKLETLGIPDTGASRRYMSDEFREQILSDYAASNSRVCHRFFPGESSLFSTKAIAKDNRPATTLSPELQEVLSKMFIAIGELHRNKLHQVKSLSSRSKKQTEN